MPFLFQLYCYIKDLLICDTLRQVKLSKERDSLVLTTKKLARDLAKVGFLFPLFP